MVASWHTLIKNILKGFKKVCQKVTVYNNVGIYNIVIKRLYKDIKKRLNKYI